MKKTKEETEILNIKKTVDAYAGLFIGEMIEFINDDENVGSFNNRILMANRIISSVQQTLLQTTEERLGFVCTQLMVDGITQESEE